MEGYSYDDFSFFVIQKLILIRESQGLHNYSHNKYGKSEDIYLKTVQLLCKTRDCSGRLVTIAKTQNKFQLSSYI